MKKYLEKYFDIYKPNYSRGFLWASQVLMTLLLAQLILKSVA